MSALVVSSVSRGFANGMPEGDSSVDSGFTFTSSAGGCCCCCTSADSRLIFTRVTRSADFLARFDGGVPDIIAFRLVNFSSRNRISFINERFSTFSRKLFTFATAIGLPSTIDGCLSLPLLIAAAFLSFVHLIGVICLSIEHLLHFKFVDNSDDDDDVDGPLEMVVVDVAVVCWAFNTLGFFSRA